MSLHQDPKYARFMLKTGWKVEIASGTYVYIKKSPFLGSFMKIQRPESIDLTEISKIAKNNHAFNVFIEPKSSEQEKLLQENKFKLSRSPKIPTATLHIDLSNKKEEIFNAFKKDTKYSLKKTKDLKIYQVAKVDLFQKSWKEAMGLRRHVPSAKDLNTLMSSFKDKSLFLVTPDGSSGSIFLHSNEAVHYWQAFSSKKGRRALAQYKIVWSGISWAKDAGAKIFDFEGIYDERFPRKDWLGFTHFKKGFGGYEVKYPGAYRQLLLPI